MSNDKLADLLRDCLSDYGHPSFTDRHGMAARIRSALQAHAAEAAQAQAQEKAVPVMVVNHVSSAEHDLPIGMKLYVHPTPADTERLAEALRMCMDIMLEHGVPTHPDADARVAYTAAEQALAAHSAQAQPPADQFDPERNVRPGDVGTELQTAEQDAADFGTGFEVDGRRVSPERVRIFRGEHAAQPPAASVPDGFVFERVNMGRGNERYVGLSDGSEGTTVQEDGDGPGDTRSRLLWRIADAALAARENPNG